MSVEGTTADGTVLLFKGTKREARAGGQGQGHRQICSCRLVVVQSLHLCHVCSRCCTGTAELTI